MYAYNIRYLKKMKEEWVTVIETKNIRECH